MLQNATTIAAWLIAGPTAAARTHKITTQIKKARNRKTDRARPAMNYDCIMIGIFPIA
jgi:hypothetical protein